MELTDPPGSMSWHRHEPQSLTISRYCKPPPQTSVVERNVVFPVIALEQPWTWRVICSHINVQGQLALLIQKVWAAPHGTVGRGQECAILKAKESYSENSRFLFRSLDQLVLLPNTRTEKMCSPHVLILYKYNNNREQWKDLMPCMLGWVVYLLPSQTCVPYLSHMAYNNAVKVKPSPEW